MELTLLSESWWRAGLFWWGVRSSDGRRGNSSSQLHRTPCFHTEQRVRPVRPEKVWLPATKVIKLQELMIMTAWKSGNDWNRNKGDNYTETNSLKKWSGAFRCEWCQTPFQTWTCVNYADSAENQLTPGQQTAESPEGRKENQWRN